MVITYLRRITVLLIVTAGLAVTTATAALAQPSVGPTTTSPGPTESGTSTTYGFDQVCNDIHDMLSQLPAGVGNFLGDGASAVCKAGNAASHPGSAIEATKSKLWDSTFGKVTEILLSGLGDALTMSTSWAWIPNDRILSSPGDQADPTQTLWGRIDSYTRQLQTWLLAFSIVISAVRIGIARAHLAAEHADEAFKMLARSTLSTWVAGTAILTSARMTDSLSSWIINDATNGNARGAAELLARTDRFGVYGPGLVFLVAIVGILGALAMTVLTIIRQALLVVAVGIFPLTAAASGSGKQAYQRLGAWIIAFLLFKPVAALVYMIAFVTADQVNTDVAQNEAGKLDSAQRGLIGIVLLCSVAFVLPALVRLVSPALSAVGSGGSGAVATGAAVGAAAALFTGGKALLARGAASGGAGTAGFVSTGGQGPTPPRGGGTGSGGTGGTGGRPQLPPSPSAGPKGAAHPLQPAATSSGSRTAAQRGIGAQATGTRAGKVVDRIGNDVTGGHAQTTGTTANRMPPDLGSHHISR
ncbi:hypothetical protein ACQP1G_20420 [Nocardia sp. CA-107356]|uniref:hypothetical protein n=1 Tax=Nocardia sp. CA-107356 TaxID=3239972 RepID=UPI003D92213A